MQLIITFFKDYVLIENKDEDHRLRRRVTHFILLDNVL